MYNKYHSDYTTIIKLEILERNAKTKALMQKKSGNFDDVDPLQKMIKS